MARPRDMHHREITVREGSHRAPAQSTPNVVAPPARAGGAADRFGAGAQESMGRRRDAYPGTSAIG
ncbi:hypothetical protein ACFQ07_05570, partial [Actinomadura adrarensis]